MKEKDIHSLIEQQEPEAKQRIWEKVSSQLELASISQPQSKPQKAARKNLWKWTAAIAALVCVVALSVVLPLTLRGGGDRYCDATQYTTEKMDKTLATYSIENNKDFLYVNWYNSADEVNTIYGYNNSDKNDIIFFTETFVNAETGELLSVSITDNKTRVDIFENYHVDCQEIKVQDLDVKYKDWRTYSCAVFEYRNNIYYLQIDIGNAQARLTEIIEDMLK